MNLRDANSRRSGNVRKREDSFRMSGGELETEMSLNELRDFFSRQSEVKASRRDLRNSQMAIDAGIGDMDRYQYTTLDPINEFFFQRWYKDWAQRTGINPDPDAPNHYYDYRGAWKNKAEPTWQPEHNQYRWDDRWKIEGHPNMDNTQ